MEADIDTIYNNFTETSPPLHAHIHDAVGTMLCIVGIFCDILIMYIFLKSKRMQTRTNLMILNWALFDALFLIIGSYFTGKIFYFVKNVDMKIRYTLRNTEMLLQACAFLFMFFLYTNFIIKSKRINFTIFLRVVYVVIILIFIVSNGLCIAEKFIYPMLFISVILILFVMFALIVKDICRCIRWCRKKKTSPNTNFRLNVARIYVYGYIINTIFYMFMLPYQVENTILYLSGNLCSLYISVYLMSTNRSFKLCVLNILKCKYGEYDVDAMIALSDECSDDEENTGDLVTFTIGTINKD